MSLLLEILTQNTEIVQCILSPMLNISHREKINIEYSTLGVQLNFFLPVTIPQ